MASTQYVTFYLREALFAVPVEEVREIVRMPAVTRIPMAPPYVEGLANLRGEVLPVVDLRTRLGLERLADEGKKVVILDRDGVPVGVVVDRTAQVLHVDGSRIDRTERGALSGEFISGVVRNEGNITLLLDTAKVLEGRGAERRSRSAREEERVRPSEGKALEEHLQVVSFEMGKEEFAFPIGEVQEIIRYAEPAAVPETPEYVRGVLDLRGSVLPIVDLRVKLGIRGRPIDEFTKVIVLDQGGLRTGFVVDRIHEVLRVPLSRIAPPPALVRSANESVRGIIERENRAILLLESGTLLSREELRLAEDSQREEDRSVPRTEEEYRVFVVFVVDGQEYGVPIDRIREINRIAGVTRIPRSPAYVEGIMNLRGEVLPVVSLRKKFDLRAAERDEQSRVLVSERDGGVTGFIVDSVVGVERAPASRILPPPLEAGELSGARSFVEGVANLEGDRIVLLLDLGGVLSEREKAALERIAEGARTRPGEEGGALPSDPPRRLKRTR